MQYKIYSVRVKNFKCFDDSKFYEFELDEEKSPVILTGPNGFGKTTFFDALELLFSKKITRFDTNIESKATNLQKNVLLNKAEADGYIVATLVNNNKDYLSFFAKIDHNMRKVSYDMSIKFGFHDGYISTEDLMGYLTKYDLWKSSLQEFDILRYSPENFDIYYYISQAESVHFLKKTITERKNAMDELLNLNQVSEWQEHIQSKLIGSRINTPKVVINDEYNAIETKIQEKISELKKCIDNNKEIEKEYNSLFSDDMGERTPFWDKENLHEYTMDQLEQGIHEVRRVSSYVNNQEDYKKYLWNKKIESAVERGVSDLILSIPYIKKNLVDTEAISHFINKQNQLLEIYNKSAFFRMDDINVELFKISTIEQIKKINPNLITFDVPKVSALCEQIIKVNRGMNAKQNILLNLENARIALQRINGEYNSESKDCPYCGHRYEDITELNEAFFKTKEMFETEKGDLLKEVDALKKELEALVNESRKAIKLIISGIDDEIAEKNLKIISYLDEFIKDKKRISDAEFIYSLILDKKGWEDLEGNEKKIEVQRICLEQKKTYRDDLFIENMKRYAYSSIESDYKGIAFDKQELLFDEQRIEDKIGYIKAAIVDRLNENSKKIKTEIKQDLIKLHKLKDLREKFDRLRKIYDEAINTYKNQILEKLRVPLLIYTGKILQDYQNGLGVFISKNEMRFVTNGEIKHDILNTFSSGQLSGFVLAFLFSMNKLYTKESEDDLGFLLIDDPVQTMDDINISSMIEVLRNDFADKQIIMSTHEMDKENYILYKFLKYNKIGQSFNVKEKLYGV